MRTKLGSILNQIPVVLKDLTASEPELGATGEFVKGINLGGEAVTIGGNRWESYDGALANGLTLNLTLPEAQVLRTQVMPQPYAGRETRQMLNSLVYRPQRLELTQVLANGSYEVYLWLIENYQADWHRLELYLNGRLVGRDLGKLPLNGWARYGAYGVTVTDGVLRLALLTQRAEVDAHLMGLSIFRV